MTAARPVASYRCFASTMNRKWTADRIDGLSWFFPYPQTVNAAWLPPTTDPRALLSVAMLRRGSQDVRNVTVHCLRFREKQQYDGTGRASIKKKAYEKSKRAKKRIRKPEASAKRIWKNSSRRTSHAITKRRSRRETRRTHIRIPHHLRQLHVVQKRPASSPRTRLRHSRLYVRHGNRQDQIRTPNEHHFQTTITFSIHWPLSPVTKRD